jgi:nitroreductase
MLKYNNWNEFITQLFFRGLKSMNQTIEIIKNRRSVRNYLPEQIKNTEMKIILEAAIYAPTGHNDQPWHFTVIQNPELIDEINIGAKKFMGKTGEKWLENLAKNENYHIFHGAPTVIIVSGKKDATTPHADCSAAVENMLLAAESMDIGSCWIGFASFYFHNPDSFKKFDIPAENDVYFGVALGYKAGKNGEAPKRKKNVVTFFK